MTRQTAEHGGRVHFSTTRADVRTQRLEHRPTAHERRDRSGTGSPGASS